MGNPICPRRGSNPQAKPNPQIQDCLMVGTSDNRSESGARPLRVSKGKPITSHGRLHVVFHDQNAPSPWKLTHTMDLIWSF